MKKVIAMNNLDDGFYDELGRIFGSRKVERVTGDRFYDDNNKTWYLLKDGDTLLAVIGVKGEEIRNCYGESNEDITELIDEIKDNFTTGTIPAVWKKAFRDAGYVIHHYTQNYFKIG